MSKLCPSSRLRAILYEPSFLFLCSLAWCVRRPLISVESSLELICLALAEYFDCDAAGTFATDSEFSVCLGPADAAALEAALLSDPDALLDAFASIDVTQAQAGHPEDQSRIMGAVEALPGGAPI